MDAGRGLDGLVVVRGGLRLAEICRGLGPILGWVSVTCRDAGRLCGAGAVCLVCQVCR
jgi:hypothetical protein